MEQKLLKIAENSTALYEKCVQNHFAAVIPGSGTDTLTFHLPFQPDQLLVLTTDPYVQTVNHIVTGMYADFATLGYLAAVFHTSNNGTFYSMAMTNTTVFNRYTRADDGTVTLKNFANSGNTCIFSTKVNYQIMAVKFQLPSDRERINALIEGLGESGNMKIWGKKVHQAFTDEEWAALKATKPGWTFEEV